MTIVLQPESLSLVGNLRHLVVNTTEDITLSVKVQGAATNIVQRVYSPNGDNRMEVDLYDIVFPELSFLLQAVSEPYRQTGIVKTFVATLTGVTSGDTSAVTFTVLRAGVDQLSDTAQTFLEQNFLTWQPNMKPVTYYTPEFLTYYAAVAATVKCKVYFGAASQSPQILTLATIPAGQAYTIPVQYAIIAGKVSSLPAYYDVWVENGSGQRLTYVQRYYAHDMKSEQEQWILFENSLGGIDTFRAYGSTDLNAQHTHNLAEIEEETSEYRVDTERKYKKNTGRLDKKERLWLLDFFPSLKKYVYLGNCLRQIVVTESDVNYKAGELPSQYNFTYRFANAKPYLNLPRTDIPLEVMEIDVPEVGSFTVAPRLVEFPRVQLSSGALFPVQGPYSEEWSTTTLGGIFAYFIQQILAQYDGGGGIGHAHSNYDFLEQLSPEFVRSFIEQFGSEFFLSKLNDDTAQGWITVLQGVRTLEEFIELASGGAFYTDDDELAHLTADVARIRQKILGVLRIGDARTVQGDESLLRVGGDARVDHNLTVDNILMALARVYSNLLTSDNYTGDGAFDTGFMLSKVKNHETRSYLVVDELFVRMKAIFAELEIRKLSYTGGNRVASHAASKIVKVVDITRKITVSVVGAVVSMSGPVSVANGVVTIDGGVTVSGTTVTVTENPVTYAKRCYAMKDDGTTQTENWWRVDDQARCQTFNIKPGVYQNVSNRDYWRRVLNFGSEKISLDGNAETEQIYDYVDLSILDCMAGSDLPEAGDTIVQMGNRTDAGRQGFIVEEVSGTNAPSYAIFRNVNSYTLEGKRKIILSPDLVDMKVNRLTIETEYDAKPVKMFRGEWINIPGHECYYYDEVTHGGETWYCIYPESGIGGVMFTTETPSESALYWRKSVAKGKDGQDGKSFNIKGTFDTTEEFEAYSEKVYEEGVAYVVAGFLYIYDPLLEDFKNAGQFKGDKGDGIQSATVSYAVSNTASSAPSSGWSAGIPTIQQGSYLWTRIVLNYTNGEHSAPSYSISYFGTDGTSPIVADCDTEVLSIACDKNGKVISAFDRTIHVSIFDGSQTQSLSALDITLPSGFTKTVSIPNQTIRIQHEVNNIPVELSNNLIITAQAVINGITEVRRMSLVINGVRPGADGTPATIYDLIPSVSAIVKHKDGSYSIPSISCTRQKTVGSTITPDTTDGTLTYKIDGGAEQPYTNNTAIPATSIGSSVEFILRIGNTIVDRETIPVVQDGLSQPSLVLSEGVVAIEVDENGKAMSDFREEVTAELSVDGSLLYIESITVPNKPHITTPTRFLSPLRHGVMTVSGTTVTVNGVSSYQGSTPQLPASVVALPHIFVSASEGGTVTESTVNVKATGLDRNGVRYSGSQTFKVLRQYNVSSLEVILSPEVIILYQQEDGNKEIVLTNAYTDVVLRIGATDITSGLSISLATYHCNASVSGNRVKIDAVLTNEGKYYDDGYIDISVSYRGKTHTKRFSFACNLLGTWKEKVKNDTLEAVAQKLSYKVEGQEIVSIDNIAALTHSSTVFNLTVQQKVIDANGNVIKTSGSVYGQTYDAIKLAVEDTGIDITNGLIKAQTGKFEIWNQAGTIKTFSIDNDGNLVSAGSASFKGKITANSGTIGGFNIGETYIRSSAKDSSDNPIINLQSDGYARLGGLTVATNGDATFTGVIHAKSGDFTGNLLSQNGNVGIIDVPVLGDSYNWRGLAVGENVATDPNGMHDLVNIGARYISDSNKYGRIMIANSSGKNIELNGSDGSIDCAILRPQKMKAGAIWANGGVGSVLVPFTPSGNGTQLQLSNGNVALLYFNSSYPYVYLPTLTEIRSTLGLGNSDNFAIDYTILGRSGSVTGVVYGYKDSTHGQDCPHLRDSNYGDVTGGLSMAQGDVIHLKIVRTSTSFDAYILLHQQ